MSASTLARRCHVAAAVCAWLVAAPVAHAQKVGASAAESLFEQGRAQMAGGDYIGACPKFEESYRLDQANGTLLALALCHEAQGKWASAWTEFLGVEAASMRDGRADRAAIARANIAALEPKVSRVVIEVSPETRSLPSFDVQCDNVHIQPSAGDLEVPLDPGDHLLQASAGGYAGWSTSLHIGVRGERTRVQVPPLEPLPAAPAVPPPPAHLLAPPDAPVQAPQRASATVRRGSPLSVQRILGLVVVGVGAATAGVAVYEGLHAIVENDDARAGCPGSPCANVTALAHSQSATTAATASDILFGAGALTVGVGAYLWFSGARSTASVSLGPRSAQLRLEW